MDLKFRDSVFLFVWYSKGFLAFLSLRPKYPIRHSRIEIILFLWDKNIKEVIACFYLTILTFFSLNS